MYVSTYIRTVQYSTIHMYCTLYITTPKRQAEVLLSS